MVFIYTRIIRLQDTDAAGVVYFANVLAICHEAYEESLATSRINLQKFLDNSVAIPIVHASVDFFRPLFCGDKISIHLMTKYLSRERFEVSYEILKLDTNKVAAKAITRHVCINPISRTKLELPKEITLWLQRWSGEDISSSDLL